MKKKILRALSICLLISGFTLDGIGQDALFSQFYNSPVYNNPAFTGVHTGRFRVVANFRDQWNALQNTTYKTTNVNFDMRSKIGRADFLTYGVNVMQDQTGTANMTLNTAGVNLGYMKQLSGGRSRQASQYLTGGFALNFGQMSINPGDLWFSNQYDASNTQVDLTLANGESLLASSDLFPDFSAGILYYMVNGDNSFFIGGAANHLNRPNYSLIENGSERRQSRYTAQAGGQIAISNTTQLLPGAIVNLQGESMSISSGLNFRYSNRDWREVAIRMGSYFSIVKNVNTNIYMPTLNTAFIMELEQLFLGISYDISLSDLAVPTNYRGAFELSVGYIKPATYRSKLKCPKL